jgi:hypothetical protein
MNKYSTVVATNNYLTCLSCPQNTQSPSASPTLESCKCNQGYTGPDGNICTACGQGTYKETVGSAFCDQCVAGKYSAATGQSSSATCQNCVAGKYSTVIASTDISNCLDCEAGKYSAEAGRSICDNCTANSYSPSASIVMSSCICNSGYAKNGTIPFTCRSINPCDQGYTGPGDGLCTACAAGSYKPTVGSVACTLCGVNTYGTTLGAISNTSCIACPGNSTSVGGSDKPNLCFCEAGYEQTKDFNACIECRPGFYDNITNWHECSMCGGGLYSAFWGAKGPETCKECGAGTWSNIGGATCQLCPPNTNSSVRSAFLTDCKCIAGATGQDGQTCQFCESNTYKSVTGSARCTACPLNSQSPSGSIALSTCICNQGFYRT